MFNKKHQNKTVSFKHLQIFSEPIAIKMLAIMVNLMDKRNNNNSQINGLVENKTIKDNKIDLKIMIMTTTIDSNNSHLRSMEEAINKIRTTPKMKKYCLDKEFNLDKTVALLLINLQSNCTLLQEEKVVFSYSEMIKYLAD